MTEAERKRKKKKQQTTIEKEVFKVVEKSMKQAIDLALDEIFKDWK